MTVDDGSLLDVRWTPGHKAMSAPRSMNVMPGFDQAAASCAAFVTGPAAPAGAAAEWNREAGDDEEEEERARQA